MKLHELGTKIKLLRKEKNYTQEQLANLCGISRVTMGKIEKGEIASISLKTFDLIVANLGYEIDLKSINNFGLDNLG
ncbi:MAG: helix-turn-helix transcriptional regulator [Arcobacteraceae bacterium]|jgi:transcriptional regulator with XRE-family HTH domain|nr:helix-turn-helix transcriptional regulator [Arcobacteraceae bacterium]